jgi:AraC-like DNA-binding protein
LSFKAARAVNRRKDMGASAGGQRLPSGGLAGQGGSTPTGDAVRNIGGQGGRQGGFGSPIPNFGQVGQRTDPRASMTMGPMNIARPLTQNPYQQAAGAQQQALATTGAATQYQTSPTAMGRMAAGMAYQPPSAATDTMTAGTQYQAPAAAMGALSRGTSYEVNPLAQQGFQRAMAYSPEQVRATSYGAAQEATPQTAASAMQAYQNPYETQVVQQTLRDIGTQAQLGQQNLAAQAQAAKAFGGSRHGIAEAEAMKGYTQQMADAAGRLRQQGFQTQLGAGQFDVGQQAASTARNVAAENVARQFGAQTGMTAQQLNQAAGLSGAQLNLAGTQALSGADLAAAQERRASANALANQALAAQQARMGAASQLAGTAAQAEQLGMGAAGQVAGAQRADVGTRMGAAGQLANLGQQSFGYGTAIQGQQQRAGEMDRAIMQNLIGAGQQSFGQYTGAPTTGLQSLIGALTGVPQGQSQSFQPGLFNYMQLGAQMYGG